MPPTETDTEDQLRAAIAADLEAQEGIDMQIVGYTLVAKGIDLANGDVAYFRLTDQRDDDVAELGMADWGMMAIRRDMAEAMRNERP